MTALYIYIYVIRFISLQVPTILVAYSQIKAVPLHNHGKQ